MHNSSGTIEILETTLDAAPVSVAQVGLQDNEVAMLNIKLLARDSSKSVKAWSVMYVAKRTGVSVQVFEGICHVHEPIGDQVPWSISVSDSGSALLVQVVGADSTIRWSGQIDYLKLSGD
jgi:hypothetical protein